MEGVLVRMGSHLLHYDGCANSIESTSVVMVERMAMDVPLHTTSTIVINIESKAVPTCDALLCKLKNKMTITGRLRLHFSADFSSRHQEWTYEKTRRMMPMGNLLMKRGFEGKHEKKGKARERKKGRR